MPKQINEGNRRTVGWDKRRRTDGKPPVYFLYYKKNKVIFSKPGELERDIIVLIDRIDNGELG